MASIRKVRRAVADSSYSPSETRSHDTNTRARSTATNPGRDTAGTTAGKPADRDHPSRSPTPDRPGKTRWERMRKDDLSLAHLSALLATEKAASGKSAQTVSWYTGVIARYADWLVAQDLEPTLAHFTLDDARAYIVALQGLRARESHPAQPTEHRPLSDATINSYVRALRAFSSWLYDEGYTQAPVLGRLKAPKMTQKTQPILTEAEIAAIANALNPRTEIGARDQAIFLLLLDTGIRAGELCGLRLPQLHLDEGYAIVLGKGRKERPIKIGARAAKAVRFYLLHWRKPALAHEDHVFLTCRGVTSSRHALASAGGEPLSVSALEQLTKRIGRQAGVERLHPHLLRHTFACLYLMRYRDSFALKALFGHHRPRRCGPRVRQPLNRLAFLTRHRPQLRQVQPPAHEAPPHRNASSYPQLAGCTTKVRGRTCILLCAARHSLLARATQAQASSRPLALGFAARVTQRLRR